MKDFKVEGRENLYPTSLTVVEKFGGFGKKCFE